MRSTCLVVGMLLLMSLFTVSDSVFWKGVNLAGAEFGKDGGIHGIDYVYPDPAYWEGYTSADYYLSKGANFFRIPFRWERIQPALFATLDSIELSRLKTTVTNLADAGAIVLIDVHSYARYRGSQIGSAAVPISAFVDLWIKLGNEFKNNKNVIFGLINEPFLMDQGDWFSAADAAIKAIRGPYVQATNLILVQGEGWASSWWFNDPANGAKLLALTDPLNNMAIEVHIFLNSDDSGDTDECVSSTIGVERLVIFTDWLRANGQMGFIGEFGGGANKGCEVTIDSALAHIEDNRDVYMGWSWWAGGSLWGDLYSLSNPTTTALTE